MGHHSTCIHTRTQIRNERESAKLLGGARCTRDATRRRTVAVWHGSKLVSLTLSFSLCVCVCVLCGFVPAYSITRAVHNRMVMATIACHSADCIRRVAIGDRVVARCSPHLGLYRMMWTMWSAGRAWFSCERARAPHGRIEKLGH